MATYKFISCDPVVDVSNWESIGRRDSGARTKETLFDAETGNLHLFKYPKEMREHQIWSELVASFIAGDLLEWEVQVTRIATRKGKVGNLLEYFYESATSADSQSFHSRMNESSDRLGDKKRDKRSETLIEGVNLCRKIDSDYDVKKGERHTLPLILEVAENISASYEGLSKAEFLDFWARAIAFDSLISNQDRHAENWGGH